VSWDQRFFDPVILPDVRKLITLRDAAPYITKLPKVTNNAEGWQAAMKALLLRARRANDVRPDRHKTRAALRLASLPDPRFNRGMPPPRRSPWQKCAPLAFAVS